MSRLILLVILVLSSSYCFAEGDSLTMSSGLDQLDVFLQKLEASAASKDQELQAAQQMVTDLRSMAGATGQEINRLIQINADLDAVTDRQAVVVAKTLHSNKNLKVSLFVGIPAALVTGFVVGALIWATAF